MIVTRGGGYVLRLGDGRLDARRFEHLVAAASAAAQAGRLLREAHAAVGDVTAARAAAARVAALRSESQAEPVPAPQSEIAD